MREPPPLFMRRYFEGRRLHAHGRRLLHRAIPSLSRPAANVEPPVPPLDLAPNPAPAAPVFNGVRRAILGVTWLSLSGYMIYLLNFITSIVLARLLFPRDFGKFALAVSSVELLSILSAFSFSQGIIQMGDEDDIADTAFVLTLWTAAVFFLVGLAMSQVLRVYYQADFSVLFFSLFVVRIFTLFTYLFSARLERHLIYQPLSSIRLVAAVLGAAVALIMAARGTGVWSLFDREMVTTFVTLVGLMAVTRWMPRPRFDRVAGRQLLHFGFQMFLARTLELIWYRSGSLVLGVFGGVAALGYYDRARYLGETGNNVVAFGAVHVAFPVYSRLQSEFARLSEAYRLTHYFIIRLMFPLLLWLVLFPHQILNVLYGARWLEAAPILQALALFAFLMPVIENMKVLLTGIGKFKEATLIRAWQAGVTLALMPLGLPRWGAAGLAGAASLGNVAALWAGYLYLRGSVASLALGSYVRPAVAAAVVAVGMTATRHGHLFTGPGRLVQLANVGTAAIAYCLLLVLVDGVELRKNIGVLIQGLRREEVAG